MGGATFTAWCAIWIVCGALPYVLIVRAVQRKIARLERSLQEEETRHNLTMMSVRKADVKREFAQYGADRPVSIVRLCPAYYKLIRVQFANLAVADMPERYQVVLDSQLVETASKVIRLKSILKADNVHRSLYVSLDLVGCRCLGLCLSLQLVMILIYMSEAIFQTAGAVDAVTADKVLPMLISYNTLAFLICSNPSVTLHLLESWRAFRSASNQHNRRRTVANFSENVFNIPLHISNRKSVIEQTAGTGIIVSQSHEVKIEHGARDTEDDKDSFKGAAL